MAIQGERGSGGLTSWQAGVVVGATAVLLLSGLGTTDLWAPDEPRYAQVAEELRALERGPADAVLLHLNGAPYTQKPPLYYWLAAAFGAPGGRVTEVAARLPSALAGVLTVALTAFFGARLLGPTAGLWGAAVLLSVYRFSHLARRAQLDVVLTCLELIALIGFWNLDQRRGSRRAAAALFHAAMGLAVLTKGPVGLLPLAIGVAFRVADGRRAEAFMLGPAWAWALSLGPGVVWLGAAVWLAPQGFFGDAVVDNVLGRFFAGTSHVRPIYYFLYQLPADFLPWTLLWPAIFWARRTQPRATQPAEATAGRLLAAWVAVPLVFFSLSAGKRGLYLLPVFPALALFCGGYLDRLVAAQGELPRGVARALLVLAACVFVCGVGLWLAGGAAISGTAVEIPAEFGAWLLAVVLASVGATLTVRRRTGLPYAHGVGIAIAAWVSILLGVYTIVYPALQAEKSPRPIAEAARRVAQVEAPIGVFDYSALVGALAYYGGPPIVELSDEASVQRFVEGGGRAIVSRARHVEQLSSWASLAVRTRYRSGSRELVVIEMHAPGRP